MHLEFYSLVGDILVVLNTRRATTMTSEETKLQK